MSKKSAKQPATQPKKAPGFFFPAQGVSVRADDIVTATEKVGDLTQEEKQNDA